MSMMMMILLKTKKISSDMYYKRDLASCVLMNEREREIVCVCVCLILYYPS